MLPKLNFHTPEMPKPMPNKRIVFDTKKDNVYNKIIGNKNRNILNRQSTGSLGLLIPEIEKNNIDKLDNAPDFTNLINYQKQD